MQRLSRTRQHLFSRGHPLCSCGSNCSYESGAEAGANLLAAEIKSTVKAKIELRGGWKGEWKESLAFSSKFNLKKCQQVYYYFGKQKYTAKGEITTWEHEVVCQCARHKNCGAVSINYCDLRQLTGNGTGWGAHYGEHVQQGLVADCPCEDIDENTRHVMRPQVRGIIPTDPNEIPEVTLNTKDQSLGESVLEKPWREK